MTISYYLEKLSQAVEDKGTTRESNGLGMTAIQGIESHLPEIKTELEREHIQTPVVASNRYSAIEEALIDLKVYFEKAAFTSTQKTEAMGNARIV
ncbi:MAG: hypothetical protein L3J05_10120, partial [Robiginitomaculum sp.]|nr:hypothetical protein [Robiginitomaculum sp.]